MRRALLIGTSAACASASMIYDPEARARKQASSQPKEILEEIN